MPDTSGAKSTEAEATDAPKDAAAAETPTPEGEAAAAAATEAAAADGAAQDAADAGAGGAAVELDELSEGAAGAEGADPREARIAELESELASVRDQLMRAAADVQNTRKRADKERKDAETYGGMRLSRDLLSVYDNLEAALRAASDELQEREPEFFNGVSLTLRNLLNSFEKHQIAKIAPTQGDRFDPNLHQAMYEAETEDAPAGSVLETLQVGFVIGERLLRPAMVSVAKAGAAKASG